MKKFKVAAVFGTGVITGVCALVGAVILMALLANPEEDSRTHKVR